jgi:hypothetical protein
MLSCEDDNVKNVCGYATCKSGVKVTHDRRRPAALAGALQDREIQRERNWSMLMTRVLGSIVK